MSWGATAYTPIITYNSPPFGFHEVADLPDFKVCNEDPWETGERMKRDIQNALKDAQAKRDVYGSCKDFTYGYDEDFKKMALRDAWECKNALLEESPQVEFFCGGTMSNKVLVIVLIIAFILYRFYLR